MEDEWLGALCRTLDLRPESLPLLWDADFLYGPQTVSGKDTYVLGEINVSCVSPFPDSASNCWMIISDCSYWPSPKW